MDILGKSKTVIRASVTFVQSYQAHPVEGRRGCEVSADSLTFICFVIMFSCRHYNKFSFISTVRLSVRLFYLL